LRSSTILANLVNRLLRQAEIGAPCSGAYVLRHTLATTMVRSGASFKDVADILGHGSLTTTGIYAKLDLPSLAKVALPWPGGLP
jgi:site-specific recombinase XerD